jgi:Protein of unknown function (DUF1579)
MKIPRLLSTVFLAATFIAAQSFAQTSSSSPAPAADTSPSATSSGMSTGAQPDPAEMMKQMMELAKLNENHKMLSDSVGTWSYTVKMWMNGDPSTTPQTSKGTAVRKAIMDGRFVVMDVTGNMEMPGADGKMKKVTFKGEGTEGYDNVKKKFVGSWIDNMGTGIMMAEGDYDPGTKTFTYTGEVEAIPGMKQKIREVVKMTDKDHMLFEWYEDRGGQEAKTMEINYTRKK